LLPTMMVAASLQVPTTAFATPPRCTVITSVSLAGGEGGHVIANNSLTASLNATTPASCTPNTPTYKWTYSSTSNMASPTTLANTSASFTPTDGNPNLVGKYVRLTFSYKPNSATTTTLDSTPTLVWPANVVIPAMDPDFPVTYTYVGNVLTAVGFGVVGFPEPVETYRWWSCTDNRDELFNSLRTTLSTVTMGADNCSVISGATLSTYTVTGSETGRYFYPEVTEKNEYGTVSAYGISLPEVTNPTFTGTSWEGQTLTRGSASATGFPSPTITYAWETTSDGTTWTTVGSAETYTVKAADRSYAAQMQIRLTATATSGSQSDSKSSDASNTYTAPNATGGSVTSDVSGTYTSGKYRVGQTVIGQPWSVMGTPWPLLTYQWYMCENPAATLTPATSCPTAPNGAGTSTHAGGTSVSDLGNYNFSYVVPTEAIGKYLTFTASLSNAATVITTVPFTLVQSRTQNSGVINSAPGTSGTPDITGIASVGKKLTAAPVTYVGNPTGKISYQWQLCETISTGCSNIGGATSTNYTATSGDQNKYLRVIATATSNAGETATALSGTPKLINQAYAIPTGTTVALDTVTAIVGETLTAITTGAVGYPASYQYVYKWYSCSAATSGSCTLLSTSGSTSSETSTFVVTSGQIGKFIQVSVVATNEAGSAAAVNSTRSNAVPKLVQAALEITTSNVTQIPKGSAGISLSVSGGTGGGAVSYAPSGTGCVISGSKLTVATSQSIGTQVTCSVVATRAATATYASVTSPPKAFIFKP